MRSRTVPYVEWWLRHGWYRLGVAEYVPVLILSAVWLWVAMHLFVFRRTRDRRGRGVLLATPILAWALFACRQAFNSTQIATVDAYSRHPYFWSCILASAMVGLLVSGVTFAIDRLLAAPGTYGGPSRGTIRCNRIAVAGWVAVWVTVFACEAVV